MQAKAKRIITSATAGLTSIAVFTGVMLAASPRVVADKVVDFSAGVYDTWDGSSYDFSWFTGTETEYEINTAAKLASLSILTNDLSEGQNHEWDAIIANVKSSVGDDSAAEAYIKRHEDFSGITLKLTANIDLGSHEWLPINYPWRTANLTSDYKFTNTKGETVKYNAVDHIPELEPVDPWVGDKNGDPISTRYWDLPESEMRFRDLINSVSYTSASKTTKNEDEIRFIWSPIMAVNGVGGGGTLTHIGRDKKVTDKVEIPVVQLQGEDFENNVADSYIYKDIKNYRENNGFSGTFDGNDNKIKGLNPSTPWTTDYVERLTTYDPLGKGLFSVIDDSGEVKNLNVKGSVDDEVYSYSGLLCAYNYGTIDNCYVDGEMKQGLIDMVYPTARDYDFNELLSTELVTPSKVFDELNDDYWLFLTSPDDIFSDGKVDLSNTKPITYDSGNILSYELDAHIKRYLDGYLTSKTLVFREKGASDDMFADADKYYTTTFSYEKGNNYAILNNYKVKIVITDDVDCRCYLSSGANGYSSVPISHYYKIFTIEVTDKTSGDVIYSESSELPIHFFNAADATTVKLTRVCSDLGYMSYESSFIDSNGMVRSDEFNEHLRKPGSWEYSDTIKVPKDVYDDYTLWDFSPLRLKNFDTGEALTSYNPATMEFVGYIESGIDELIYAQAYSDVQNSILANSSPDERNTVYALSNNSYFVGSTRTVVESDIPIFTDVPEHGTVMPVGNSGFMSAINYGTIKNSYTVGEVTQAFRQFGFFAAVNYGQIDTCTNKADISTTPITTDFTTDEFAWTGTTEKEYTTLSLDNIGYGDPWNGYDYIKILYGYSRYAEKDTDAYYQYADTMESAFYKGWIMNSVVLDASAWMYGTPITVTYSTDTDISTTENENVPYYGLWIPHLYRAEEGESIAANHLYGIYQQSVVGGIAAVNRGVITDSVNKGTIETLGNVSPRNNFAKIEWSDATKSLRESYNCIRPNNAYGIFSTAYDTNSAAGGIAGINFSTISACENSGRVNDRSARGSESFKLGGNMFEDKENIFNPNTDPGSFPDGVGQPKNSDYRLDFIPFTENGHYQNDCRVMGQSQLIPYAYGYKWWITEDNKKDSYNVQFTTNVSSINEEYYSQYRDGGWYKCPEELKYFDRNMPYPYFADYSGKTFIQTAGIAAQNVGKIEHCTNTAAADAGIVMLSLGLDETAIIDNCTQNNSSCRVANICNNLIDSNLDNCEVTGGYTGTVMANIYKYDDPGTYYIGALANYAYQRNLPMSVNNNTVYGGSGGFREMIGSNAKIEAKNNVLYQDNVDLADNYLGFALNMEKVNVDKLYNNQYRGAVAKTAKDCSFNEVYVYGKDVTFGFVDELDDCKVTYLTVYAQAPRDLTDALGAVERKSTILGKRTKNSDLSDIYIYSDIGTSQNFSGGIGDFASSSIKNSDIFVDFDLHLGNFIDCELTDVSVFGDSTSNLDNSKDYVLFFQNSDLKDCIFQTNVDFGVKHPSTTTSVQNIPGMLKAYVDTNTFDNCVIQTPNGVLSYPTVNFVMDVGDNAAAGIDLINSVGSRENGALAYYMDKGDTTSRTYEWTVADNDVINLHDKISSACDIALLKGVRETLPLPSYTRKIKASSEKPFYAVYIPFNSNGAGEIVGKVTHNSVDYETKATGQLYPKTRLYGHEGDAIALNVTENDGFELIGMKRASIKGTEEIPNDNVGRDKYVHTEEIVPDYDITIEGVWSNVYTIEIDDTMDAWVDLRASATGSARGKTVYLTAIIKDESFALKELYYYKYILNKDNLLVLDTANPVSIPVKDMSFKMPAANIKIFAGHAATASKIDRFVLGGVEGEIDHLNKTITVQLDTTVDLTSLTPDVLSVSENATVSPSIDVPQDFTVPVTYIVRAESGEVSEYVVTVIPTVDGEISQFKLSGKNGVIDQENGTITIHLASSIDLSALTPYVIWSGTAISPDVFAPQDFRNDVVYTVTASDGNTKDYTVTVVPVTSDKVITAVEFEVDGVTYVAVIDDVNRKITLNVPYGTEMQSVILTKLTWYGRSISVDEDAVFNMTITNYITVVDDFGNSYVYTLTARENPDSVAKIVQFRLYGKNGVIDEAAKTITVTVPTYYDVTNIAPNVILFTGDRISDRTEKKNFSSPVQYTVTAYDGTEVTYTVIVNKE